MNIGVGLPTSTSGISGELLLEWAKRADAGPFSSLGVGGREERPAPAGPRPTFRGGWGGGWGAGPRGRPPGWLHAGGGPAARVCGGGGKGRLRWVRPGPAGPAPPVGDGLFRTRRWHDR